MSIFQRALTAAANAIVGKALQSPVENRGGWFPIIHESYAGAWQQNVEVDYNIALSYHAVFACITLISSDIAKLRVKLVRNEDGIWTEAQNPSYTPVLRKPNHYQNRIQFWENWIISKLTRGNTYVLKGRDGRNVVTKLFVLDPAVVRPLVAEETGDVFYELRTDNLANIPERIIVPAREIIHDRMNCLFHPLVGTSPIFAGGLAAMQGINIQNNSTNFFGNKSMPGGILLAPGRISNETADRLKTLWDDNFTGTNRGKTAVLGDNLKYQAMSVNAEDSQLIEQLKWSAEIVCSAFHVPPYKIGVGAAPSYNNVQALNVEYYSQCLQRLIEDAEICLDEGLAMDPEIGTEFDLDGLLRMDTVTQITSIRDAVGAGIMAPNEGRKKIDLKPVKGGDTPYLQQQNYGLAALADRDAENPLKPQPQPTITPAPPAPPDDDEDKALDRFQFEAMLTKGAEAHAAG